MSHSCSSIFMNPPISFGFPCKRSRWIFFLNFFYKSYYVTSSLPRVIHAPRIANKKDRLEIDRIAIRVKGMKPFQVQKSDRLNRHRIHFFFADSFHVFEFCAIWSRRRALFLALSSRSVRVPAEWRLAEPSWKLVHTDTLKKSIMVGDYFQFFTSFKQFFVVDSFGFAYFLKFSAFGAWQWKVSFSILIFWSGALLFPKIASG